MEPNLRTWLENTTQFEESHKQLFEVMYEAFQEQLEVNKEDVADFYGNNV